MSTWRLTTSLIVAGQAAVELVAVGDLAEEDLREALGPGQRAGVGADDSVSAALHVPLLPRVLGIRKPLRARLNERR